MLIRFDEPEEWVGSLAAALKEFLPGNIAELVRATKPEYVEDARDAMFRYGKKEEIINATLNWIRNNSIQSYHGTRLTDGEVQSIKEEGLLPLDPIARKERLTRALSQHPNWGAVKARLDNELINFGEKQHAGKRDNQVHLTLSRVAILKDFDHYLTHGSEFDGHVAYKLLGQSGQELLANDGEQILIHVSVPGDRALGAAHPYFSVEQRRECDEIPNLVKQILEAFSYRFIDEKYQHKVDCGMVFSSVVPTDWIIKFEKLSDV